MRVMFMGAPRLALRRAIFRLKKAATHATYVCNKVDETSKCEVVESSVCRIVYKMRIQNFNIKRDEKAAERELVNGGGGCVLFNIAARHSSR